MDFTALDLITATTSDFSSDFTSAARRLGLRPAKTGLGETTADFEAWAAGTDVTYRVSVTCTPASRGFRLYAEAFRDDKPGSVVTTEILKGTWKSDAAVLGFLPEMSRWAMQCCYPNARLRVDVQPEFLRYAKQALA